MALAAAWAELYAECEDWNGELFKPPQAPQVLVKVADNSCGIQEAGCVKDEPNSEHNPEFYEVPVAAPSVKIKKEFLEDMEQQQLVNITSTDHVGNKEHMLKLKCVKEEPISEWDQNVSEAIQALLTDLSIKSEFALNNGEFQPVNVANSDNGLKLPHTQEVNSTVKHLDKHQTDLASAVNAIIDEADKLASKPNSLETGSEDAEPACGSKGSSCAIVPGESALQQIVAGCYVKLQRLRLTQCGVCDKIFHKRSSFRTHHINSHVIKNKIKFHTVQTNSHVTKRFNTVQANSVGADKRATDLAKVAKLQPCDICNEKFAFKAEMLIHKLKRHTRKGSLTCESQKLVHESKKEFVEKTRVNENCHTTGKQYQFNHLHKLSMHIMKLQPCDICNEKFAFKAEMLIHKLKRHTRKGSLTCESQKLVHESKKEFVEKARVNENCHTTWKQYQFNHLHILSMHIMKLQSGIKFYSCKFCKETFKLREEMIRHLQSHTVENYASDMYDRRFPLNSGLQSNWVTYKDKLVRTKQSLHCGYCYHSFNDEKKFWRHMKQHFQTHRTSASEQQHT